jgi:uncharacterized integral membrane protein (TIGR00698 family)
MNKILNKIPGILLCVIIAVPAWLLGKTIPIIGSPVLGILFGMIFAMWKRPTSFHSGISYTSKKILQYSIILLGFDMNLFQVFKVGNRTLLLMVFTLTTAFLTAYILGKILKIEKNTNILIAVGSAICGGSAIAATAPVIDAKEEEVASSISTIFLFNVIAAFLFPFLGHLLHLTDYNFGLWAGTAVNDTSSVVAAGYTFSDAAGDLAVIVKLTRTLMIVPVTLVLAFLVSTKKSKDSSSNFKLSKIFPWFVLGFVAASIVSTFLPIPPEVCKAMVKIGKFMIVMAMAAIGLNTNIVKLIKNGWKPILLGFGCWTALALVSLIVINLS